MTSSGKSMCAMSYMLLLSLHREPSMLHGQLYTIYKCCPDAAKQQDMRIITSVITSSSIIHVWSIARSCFSHDGRVVLHTKGIYGHVTATDPDPSKLSFFFSPLVSVVLVVSYQTVSGCLPQSSVRVRTEMEIVFLRVSEKKEEGDHVGDG